MKLQATGYSPIDIHEKLVVTDTQMLDGDKRGVRVVLIDTGCGGWVGVLDYITSWPTERPFTRITSFFTPASLLDVSEVLREWSKSVLPPGAGYPATPQFETRQSKLQGMLEVATLTALSNCLAQV